LYDILDIDTIFIEEHIQNYHLLGVIKQKDQKVWFNGGLLYDFGVSVGDVVWIDIVLGNSNSTYLPNYGFGSRCCIIENIEYENGKKKIYTNNDVWIEGMGSPAGIFGSQIEECVCMEWYNFSLGCFKHNNTIKYVNNVCYSCFHCPSYYPLNYYGVDIMVNSMHDFPHATGSYEFCYQETPLQVSLEVWTPPLDYAECGLKPYSYHWSTNSHDYIIEDSTIYNPLFDFLGNVSVYLKVTDKLGDIAYDTVNLIMLPSHIEEEIRNTETIAIYPNPTSGELQITSNELQVEKIDIFDVCGRKQKVESRRQNVWDISHLQSGIYFLQIDHKTIKVIKK
jgi:hypothetical protein